MIDQPANCTCHPDDRPDVCQKKFAASECIRAAEAMTHDTESERGLPPYKYDPETGVFINTKTGRVVCKSKTNYGKLYVNGKVAYAHRCAWFLVYGEWPEKFIDHINGDKSDNRISNLRLADNAQNVWNQKDKAKFKGWSKHYKTGIYTVHIRHRGMRYAISGYKTPEEAQAAYRQMRMELRGEQWNA